jgi:predicted Zn-dependent peptidase
MNQIMYKYKIISIFILLLNQGFAQNFELVTDSSNGRTYQEVKGDPMKTRIYTLDNGLTVMFSLNRDQPRVYTCIGTRAGSKNDPKTATGLAHYLEHMLFKGTDQYGTKDFRKEKLYLDEIDSLYVKYGKTKDEGKRKKIYHYIDSISGLAAQFAIANEYDKMVQHIGAKGTNAYTSFDETVYINDIPSNRIADWVQIESERFRNPVLRLFHTELEAVYEEKNISLDSDDNKVFEELFAGLFRKHTYGTQTTIGTIEHLKNPSLIKIREFYNNWYVPNNMVVSIAGEFNYEKTIDLIDENFGKWISKDVPEFTFLPEQPKSEPTVKEVFGPESEYVTLGFKLPAPSKKETATMRVFEMLLQNSKSGLFDLNLIKKQLVLDASAGIYMLHDYSILFMDGRPKTGQTLEEVKTLILAQIDSLKAGKFNETELRAIITNAEVDELKQMESNSGRAFKMVNAFIQETPWNEVVEQTELMKKVTKQDIIDFANKWINNDFTIVYKRVGEDKDVVKIDKPIITPVEVNRNSVSRFAKDILDNEIDPVNPVFANYQQDIDRRPINEKVDLLSVKNKKNSLFQLYYVFEFGRLANQKLPFAVNLLEYLGTDRFSSEEISKQFYAIGCDFNVFAGNDQTYVSLSGPQEKFERAISTLEYLLKNVKPDQSVLNSLIEDEVQDRIDAKTNKYAIRNALSAYVRYGKSNPTNWVISNSKLKKMKAQQLTSLIHDLTSYEHKVMYFGPENPEIVLKTVKKYHILPDNMKSLPKSKEFAYRKSTERNVFFTNHEMVQAEIGWVRNTGIYNPEFSPKIAMFNEYFGGGMSSIVFQTIRESKALAYSSYAFFSNPSEKDRPYYTGAYIGTQADKLDSAIIAMDELLNVMPESEVLFSAAKSALISKIESERIINTSLLFSYLSSSRLGLDYDIRSDIYEKIKSYDIKNVADFHKENIENKSFDMYVLASKERVKENQLKKYGKFTELTLKEIFGY